MGLESKTKPAWVIAMELVGLPLNKWGALMNWLPAGSSGAVLARGSSAGLAFLATIVWARALDPSAFGAYALALAALGVVSSVAMLGIDQLTSRELGILAHQRDWPHFWGHLRWAAKLIATTSVVGGICAAGLLWANPMGWTPASQGAALWMMLALPGAVFLRWTRGCFQAADRTSLGLFWELSFWNGLFVFVGVCIWLSGLPVEATGASWAYAATITVAALAALASFRRLSWPHARPSSAHDAKWIRAGFGFAALAIVGFLLQQADLLVLGAIGTNQEAGLYSIASRSAILVVIVVGPINQVLGPRLAKAWVSDDPTRAAAIATQAAQLSILAGVALLAFYLFFGKFFLLLFGAQYTDAAPVLSVLALSQLSLLLAGPGIMALVMTGGERIAAGVTAIAVMIGIPLAYVFYGLGGIEAMAWARVVSLSFLGLGAGVLAQRRLGARIDPWHAPKKTRETELKLD